MMFGYKTEAEFRRRERGRDFQAAGGGFCGAGPPPAAAPAAAAEPGARSAPSARALVRARSLSAHRSRSGSGLALLLAALLARADVAVPPLTARVTDLTGTLSGGAVTRIEAKLADLEAKKGSQIAVLIVPTTQPEEIEQFGIRVADAWKLGRKGVDDGALLARGEERPARAHRGGVWTGRRAARCDRQSHHRPRPSLRISNWATMTAASKPGSTR